MRRKTPCEKKRDELDLDHRIRGGESNKGFRKTWPRAKAGGKRMFRRAAGQAIEAATQRADYDDLTGTVKSIKPKAKLHKWGVMTLRESVADRQRYRGSMAGACKERQRRREHESGR